MNANIYCVQGVDFSRRELVAHQIRAILIRCQVSLSLLRDTDADNVVINYVRCAGTRVRHLRLAISAPHQVPPGRLSGSRFWALVPHQITGQKHGRDLPPVVWETESSQSEHMAACEHGHPSLRRL